MGTKLKLAAVSAAMVLAACGGGSDDSASSTTSTAVESTTTTTLGSSAATDAATLTAADMGGEWAPYPDKPKGTTGGERTCADTDTSHAFDTVVAQGQGKILQRGKQDRYVQTTTWAFDSVADAKAFAASRMTDAWIECVRAGAEAGLTKEPVQTVKTYGVDRKPNGTVVGQYGLEFDEEIDGKQAYAGGFAFHTLHQKGKVVVDEFYQAIARDTDPAGLNDTIGDELNAGMEKVFARVPAA